MLPVESGLATKVSTPAAMAAANSEGVAVSFSFSALAMPRKRRDRITPEFPRAPLRRPLAAASAAWVTVTGFLLPHSAAPFDIVRLMLVPVSPSGTGKTFSSLTSSL